jgi:MSHA type pilus biogenesis protein MshL
MAAPVERRATFREAASVILNPETGVINVRATSRQHEKVQEFISQVTRIARRQVLIEATIAEVQLTDNYQQGIDWTAFAGGGKRGGATVSLNTSSPDLTTNAPFAIGLGRGRELVDSIKLLETYGDVKVLSSPKLSVMNNQTALLKVVNNIVYFEIKSDVVANTNTQAIRSFTATPRSVSVGLVMAVTPQISADGYVLLNVRPTISRKVGDAQDPTPDLSSPNLVPVIQTRELESVMRVASGETAVLGGLMQDELNFKRDSIPGVSALPFIGALLSARNETSRKTELVVLIRPVVINDASLEGDYRSLVDALPDRDFMQPSFPLPGVRARRRSRDSEPAARSTEEGGGGEATRRGARTSPGSPRNPPRRCPAPRHPRITPAHELELIDDEVAQAARFAGLDVPEPTAGCTCGATARGRSGAHAVRRKRPPAQPLPLSWALGAAALVCSASAPGSCGRSACWKAVTARARARPAQTAPGFDAPNSLPVQPAPTNSGALAPSASRLPTVRRPNHDIRFHHAAMNPPPAAEPQSPSRRATSPGRLHPPPAPARRRRPPAACFTDTRHCAMHRACRRM